MSSILAAYVSAWAGVLGLAVGSFLNVVAYRIPEGISLRRPSRCPGCGARIRWVHNIPVWSWVALRGRCAACSTSIPVRYPLVELGTGVFFVLVALGVILARPLDLRVVGESPWFGTVEFWGTLAVLELFAAISVVLTLIDLDTHRLPNSIVLPGWAVVAGLLAATTILAWASPESHADWPRLVTALIGGIALYAFYFVIRFISPRGMGGGDVKLAGLVGTVIGWFGWGALIVGAFAGFVLAALFGIALILLRGAGRKTAIPFGPWMLAGAWLGIVVGERLSTWYLGL